MRAFLDQMLGRRAHGSLPMEGRAPELAGLTGWLNGGPTSLAAHRGKVVLLEFWTTSCINCLRTLPHVQGWHAAYGPSGLTVIGVHTPEYSYEGDEKVVRRAVERHGLTYPIAIDSDGATWKAFGNRYWPAYYLIDGEGNIRAHHFGEGGYREAERELRQLLTEAGHDVSGVATVSDKLLSRAPSATELTPETHLGWDRLEYLGSAETVRVGQPQEYSCPPDPSLNIFYFEGRWRLEGEYAETAVPGARLLYRCRAADVYIVADGAEDATLEIVADGQALSRDHYGHDVTEEDGRAVVRLDGGRLYHLVSQPTASEMTLKLIFRREGTRAYTLAFS